MGHRKKKRKVRSTFHIFRKLGSASVPGSHRKKEKCGPLFTFSVSWAQHQFQVHTAKKKCDPIFTFSLSWAQHLFQVHTAKKKEMCDPIFTFSVSWAQHLFQVHTAKKKKSAVHFSHFL